MKGRCGGVSLSRWLVIDGIIAIIVFSLSPCVYGQIACRYEVRYVQENFCGKSGTAVAPLGMNDLNPPTVAGTYLQCPISNDRPFYWISDQSNIVPMGLPPSQSAATAQDVNNVTGKLGVGQIIVSAFGGYLWEDGQWIPIPPPPGGSGHDPAAIAGNQLIVAGSSYIDGWRVARWDGRTSETLQLPFGTTQYGFDISLDGTKIAGRMQNSPSVMRAFIWEDGDVIDPEWLPDSSVTFFDAVNDFGEGAGGVRVPDPSGQCSSVIHAAVWRNGELTDVGVLAPYLQSGARDINNAGIVLGLNQDATCQGGGMAPFVWSRDLGMVNLVPRVNNPDGVYLPPCVAINERGEIACQSFRLGTDIAVILTPLPRNGDVNCDSIVNVDDLLEVINKWGPCRGCQADLTEDWMVNVDDLLEVINHWTP